MIILGILLWTVVLYCLWLPKKTYRVKLGIPSKKTLEALSNKQEKKIKPKTTSIGYADKEKRIKYAQRKNISVDQNGRVGKQKNKD